MGICPVCKLRFQIPFANAPASARKKESRPSERVAAGDPFDRVPLPGVEDSQDTRDEYDKLLDEFAIHSSSAGSDSTSESAESSSGLDLKSPGLEEGPGDSADSETSLYPPVNQDSGADAWYILGRDRRNTPRCPKSDVHDRIKDNRVTRTTRVWQDDRRVHERRDVFSKLAVNPEFSVKKSILSCASYVGFALVMSSLLLLFIDLVETGDIWIVLGVIAIIILLCKRRNK